MVEGLSYDNFNTHQELDLYNETTGEGGITTQWLETRSQMLAAFLKANTRNQMSTTHTGRGNFIYQDLADSNHPINLTDNSTTSTPVNDPDSPLIEDAHLIKFTGNTAQTLNGGASDDYLFGGTAADTLNGSGGNDYLEGGLGNDTLDGGADNDTLYGMAGEDSLVGGAGNDTLVGGKDNDTLTGGLDNDQLEGGAGDDTYIFTTGDGNDVITDNQGTNILKINGTTDITATRIAPNSNFYIQNNDTNTLANNNIYLKADNSLWVLLKDQGGSIEIKNWSESNNFGITLAEAEDTYTNNPNSPTYQINASLLQPIAEAYHALPESIRPNYDLTTISSQLRSYIYREHGEIYSDMSDQGLIYDDVGDTYSTTNTTRYPFMNAFLFGESSAGFGIGYGFQGSDQADIISGFDGDITAGGRGTFAEGLNGMGGDDRIVGRGGQDMLVGGSGSDMLTGGEGNDLLMGAGWRFDDSGQSWPVYPSGQTWLDRDGFIKDHLVTPYYNYETHTDRAYFENYQADSEQDHNRLEGGQGEDTLVGAESQDFISGGLDRDHVLGGAGQDILDGGSGNDEIWGDSHLSFVWRIAETGVYNIDIDGTSTPYQSWESSQLRNIFMINQADIGNVNIQLYDDTILAGEGDDTVLGEIGADLIFGGEGNDKIMGDRFNSEAFYQYDQQFLRAIGETVGTVNILGTDYQLGAEIRAEHRKAGTLGWQDLDLSLQGNDTLHGGLGNDDIMGNSGNDLLYGDEGDDELRGDDPKEGIYNGQIILFGDTGATGNDTLLGGAGNDYLEGNLGDDWLDGGTDTDTLYGGMGNDFLAGGSDNDELYGGEENSEGQPDNDQGHDTLEGGAGDDALYAGAGNDLLHGDTDNDLLFGGEGNDTLQGGDDTDLIYGEAGDDLIEGGKGNDRLFGGAGADRYLFSVGDGQDMIAEEQANSSNGFNDNSANTDPTSTNSENSVYFDFDPSAVTAVSRAGNDLCINYGDSDQIRVKDYYLISSVATNEGVDPTYAQMEISSFHFSDGTIWTTPDIMERAAPPVPDATLPSPLDDAAYFIKALVSQDDPKTLGKTVISYRFATNANQEKNFKPFTSEQILAVEQALSQFSAHLNLQFVETTEASSDLQFFLDDLTSGDFGGAAGYANSGTGEVHLHSRKFSAANSLNAGQYGFEVILHELGHALGLKHPFEPPSLPTAENNQNNTVMSYTANNINDTELKVFDIAALQYLYGVNPTLSAEDNLYDFSQHYIADGAGYDVFNASAQQEAVTINLTAGEWSFIGAKQDSLLADGQTVIGYGTVIEAAIGGEGNDTLQGNQVNNQLAGGLGDDSLTGGVGNDVLMGGKAATITFLLKVLDKISSLIQAPTALFI